MEKGTEEGDRESEDGESEDGVRKILEKTKNNRRQSTENIDPIKEV